MKAVKSDPPAGHYQVKPRYRDQWASFAQDKKQPDQWPQQQWSKSPLSYNKDGKQLRQAKWLEWKPEGHSR